MKVFFLVSTGILFTTLGCSGRSQQVVVNSAPTVPLAPSAPASAPAVTEQAVALPVLATGRAVQKAWSLENVKNGPGDAVAVKGTSLDGKFDLVILHEGRYSFFSFARHGRWESVHNLPAKGKLMSLRLKFEDGQEKRVEWDELGFETENLYSVLWSYPAKTDSPIGLVKEGSTRDSAGGDELLAQDIIKHKMVLIEVEPGLTTQFDLTGLAEEMAKARGPKSQPVLAASQGAQ